MLPQTLHLKLINLQAQTLPLHLFTIVLCVYYRRDGDNEEDIEILDLSHLVNDYYFSIAVKNLVPRAFFKTQSYMSVLDSMVVGRSVAPISKLADYSDNRY